MTNNAKKFIDSQDTKFARTYREKSKYLVGKLTIHEIPHPVIWWEILKIAKGLAK
jgi:hypothetical protein